MRNKEIVKLNKQGWTLQAIGDKYGLTRERIRQILVKSKIKPTEVRKAKRQAHLESLRKDVCELLRQGYSIGAACEKLGVTRAMMASVKIPNEALLQKDIASLLARMDIGEHWIWKGAVNPVSGVPVAWRGRITNATRVQAIIWTAFKGKPTGQIRVTCGEKLCCNPDHLKEMPRRRSILKKRFDK